MIVSVKYPVSVRVFSARIIEICNIPVHVQYLLKSVDSNCFALLDLQLLSTAQRTEAQLFAMKYVSVKQSIFIKSCKPR